MSLWALAGLVYPVAIHASGGKMLPRDYTYFIASLALMLVQRKTTGQSNADLIYQAV